MDRQELAQLSEAYIKQLLRKHLPSGSLVYLFGSRARHDDRWNSDYDLWIDAEIAQNSLAEIADELEEKFGGIMVSFVQQTNKSGGVSSELRDLLALIQNQPGLKVMELAVKTNQSLRTLERKLKQLKDSQLIEFRGAPKTGGYYSKNDP